MALFKDRGGREWSIAINYALVEKVEAATGFNILGLTDPREAAKLTGLKFLNVLWLLCEREATSRQLDRDAFLQCLNGDAAEQAGVALEEELINFSPSRLKPTLTKLHNKAREFRTAQVDQATTVIEKINPAELARLAMSAGATSSPGSSASTPPDSP